MEVVGVHPMPAPPASALMEVLVEEEVHSVVHMRKGLEVAAIPQQHPQFKVMMVALETQMHMLGQLVEVAVVLVKLVKIM